MILTRRNLVVTSAAVAAGAVVGTNLPGGLASASTGTGTPDRVLRNGEHYPFGFTVPAGQVWAFDTAADTTVTSSGNVVVEGTLRMGHSASTHTLRFTDVVESKFKGDGVTPVPSDVGLWVVGAGILDAVGVARDGWNRTGTSPTWRAGDEVMVAPNKPGDYTFRPFTPGSLVPTVTAPDGLVQKTEVFNLTRSVRIEGTPGGRSHVMIRSSRPQTIKYVAFRHLGPRKPNTAGGQADTVPVLGRYPLHFHHAEQSSRGSLVEGCVVRDSSRGFVPHGSHGITIRDCLTHQTLDDAYWWDEGHDTHDTVLDHCASFGVGFDPVGSGTFGAFTLGVGVGNRVIDCAAVGVRGNQRASGFHWPSSANQFANVWVTRDIVAHNNPSSGVFVWQNDANPHLLEDLVCYSNGSAGVMHGAYGNSYRYEGVRCWDNAEGDVQAFALTPAMSGRQAQAWTGVLAPHLVIQEHNAKFTPSNTFPLVFRDLRTRRVTVNETKSGAGTFHLHCAPGWDLKPTDVTVKRRTSKITVFRSDGTSFDVR